MPSKMAESLEQIQQTLENEIVKRQQAEEALRRMTGVITAIDGDFLTVLVDYLANDLQVDCVWAGELSEDSQSITIIATSVKGQLAPGYTYNLEGTPCHKVVVGKECVVYPENVTQLFPEPKLFADMGIEGYIGHPLLGAYGQPLGLLVIIDSQPLKEVESKKTLLQTFGARAAQELERKKAEEELLYVSEEIDLFSSSLKQLHHLKSTNHGSFEDLLTDYLKTGCDLFGLSIGIICQIKGQSYIIRAAQSGLEFLTPGMKYKLKDTCCAEVFKEKKTITYCHESEIAEMQAAPMYQEKLRLKSYIGTPIFVNGKIDGTLNFSSVEKSRKFKDYELEIIELMAQNLATEIERRQAEEALRTSEKALRASTLELKEKNEALENTLNQLKETQNQLILQEKMASLGNLVAGVAHEINNPIGAIHSAADVANRGLQKIKTLLHKTDSRQLQRPLELLERNNQVITTASERITKIVQSLRTFARLDEAQLQKVNLHENIDTTLTLIHHELRDKIDVIKEYGDIPPIQCYPSELNQVFMHLLRNAIQAIEQEGTITIATFVDETQVCVRISDTGKGVPPEVLSQIFDPGFTTQGVGVGTGLGLSIVYNIAQKHKGDIKAESEVGKGTAFLLTLPIEQTS